MAKPACNQDEFIRLFESVGATKTAEQLGVTIRNVFIRRRSLEQIYGRPIISPDKRERDLTAYTRRVLIQVKDGIGLVGSDAHIWPGERSCAMRGFVHMAKLLNPEFIVLNGDNHDGAKTSRHPSAMFTKAPNENEELEAIDDCLTEIEKAAPKARRIWTLGNHDYRFESGLAAKCPEYQGVKGFALADHFQNWEMCISTWINNDVVIKHRWKGGVHATHNNTVNAGKTMITGHLHSLKVTPFDDYNGTRWGVDTGTLATLDGPQFSYGEDSPTNHRAGFIVLTFKDGQLLWPEIAAVMDEHHIQFRGEIIQV